MALIKKSSGILGMNARNLSYIAQYNSKANRRLADDKIFTKHFLQARGIGIAKLFTAVRSLSELRNFNPEILPKSFVIKPNRGFGGEGIVVIKDKRNNTFIAVDGTKLNWSDLYKHCIAILDGKYSITGLHDQVIFEERLISHDYFKPYIDDGLPDVRIIVFNYVPVIAMLRLPTTESYGKANLHLGAIGLGIDIGTGKTTFGVKYNKLIKKLPSGESVGSMTIPDWEEVLITASKTQHMTQIGYLAVDLALTKTGIKILELNVRAGLAIQLSNQVFLRKRLEKIADLKVVSATEGVRIGRTLFTKTVKETTSKQKQIKPVIGLFEYITLRSGKGQILFAKIDPHAEQTVVDDGIELNPDDKLLQFQLMDKKLKVPFIKQVLGKVPYQLILPGKYLSDFLIDTSRITEHDSPKMKIGSRDEKILQNIDKKINDINDQIKLLARLKPTNLLEEQKKFVKNPGYSPQFTYRTGDTDINYLKGELKRLPKQVNHPLMPLYDKKAAELDIKLSLIAAIGTQTVTDYSQQLYGAVSKTEYNEAVSFIENTPVAQDKSKRLSMDEVSRRITAYLTEHALSKWRIKMLNSATVDMQINKQNAILINRKAKFTENRLNALIAHEIETHVFRLENGRLQPYHLLQQGTAGYLKTEEGLAIFNQNQLNIPLGEKLLWPALNVVAVYKGNELSFSELFQYLIDVYNIDRLSAWKICIKIKRGLSNTGEGGSFTKDKVYFEGYQKIQQLANEKGRDMLKRLYIGKVGIDDLRYLSDDFQKNIKFLPWNLQ